MVLRCDLLKKINNEILWLLFNNSFKVAGTVETGGDGL